MMNPMAMDGRNVIVTGAGQGIGLAISRLVIELGGQVVGVDMSAPTLESAAAGLPAGKFVPVVGSVTDQAVAHAAVAAGISAFGSIDGLVNNAGISRPALISKMSMESWQAVMDVHVNGSFLFTQAVGQHMLDRASAGEKNPGSIVFVASDAGRRGSLGQINYAAAKSAMFGMTMTVAREWARFNVRCNAVCFGVVETAMTEVVRSDERFRDKYLEQIPLGRWSTPEEAATPTVFLLSNAASYITGQILSVNGGFTIAV